MIQIYLPGNTDYTKNGDTVLDPISCIFTPEINGAWTVELENALDDRHQYIVQNAVLSVPTPFNENELFRIQKVIPSDSGVYAIALPLFLDSKNEVFIYDKRPTNKTGQGALDDLMEGTKYFGHSNISTANTSYFQMKNLIECIAGDDENSFLKRWGGEVRYSNYDIYINDRLGSDNGARVEFGFNLSSIKETIDMSEVVTQIIPVAYNGYTLPNGETVDSPNINKYPIVYKRVIHYPDIKLAEDIIGDEENIIVCNTLDELYAALRARAKQEYDNGIDLPSITYDVDMIDLAQTLEYQKFKALVTVNLGDDVYVKHRRLDIETKARIIKLEYDCIRKKIINLIIGDYVPNYFDKQSDITHSVSQVINTNNNTVFADKIKGIIDLMQTGLKAQKDIAQKQDVRAILFEDLDPNSPTFGAMCLGTQGIQIAKKRNETNTDWAWGTAIDFQAIYAQYIIAGTLSDKLGLNYWNLDTGEFRLSANTKVGNTTLDDYIKNKIPDTDDLSQEEVFNALTNNGSIKGIYMYNGQLYVNGGYINADTLSAISANLGNITAGSININGKFVVTSDGALTSTSGEIGGITINENGLSTKFLNGDNYIGFDITNNGGISTFNTDQSGSIESMNYRMYLDAENLHLSKVSSIGDLLAYSLYLNTSGFTIYDDSANTEIARAKLNDNSQLELNAPSGILIDNSATITGALTCNNTLKVSGKATFGRIDASNEYLTGSLYVGGKTSTSDGKTGVAFGSSGNITMQGSTAPTLNFIGGTAKSPQSKISADSNGNLTVTCASMVLPNAKPICGKDVNGNNVEIARVGGESGNPVLIIGDTLYTNGTGITNIGGGSRVQLLTSKERIIFERNDTSDTSYTANLKPNTDGKCNLGSTGNRFKQLFASTTTISTSDEREKNNIIAIKDYPSMRSNENVLEILFSKLIPKTYYLNLESDTKELHIGFIAQDIVTVLKELGMSEENVAFLHHDFWVDEETGKEKDMYGLRYEEFIALNTYMIQKQQKEIDELKKQVEELKSLLKIGGD